MVHPGGHFRRQGHDRGGGGVGDAAALDVFPKLFVASEGETAAGDAERMADESRGDWNALFLAPGQASGQALLSDEAGGEPAMDAIVARLEERR